MQVREDGKSKEKKRRRKNEHLQLSGFLVSLFHLLPAFLESLARLTRSRHRVVPGHEQHEGGEGRGGEGGRGEDVCPQDGGL